MSQMSIMKTTVEMTNVQDLTNALDMCATTYQGLTHQMVGQDIHVRYAGIEQYRRNGNLKFKWNGASFQAEADEYHTNGKLEQVISTVSKMYRRAATEAVLQEEGTVIQQDIELGVRMMVVN